MPEFTAEDIMHASRMWGCSEEAALRGLEAEEAERLADEAEED